MLPPAALRDIYDLICTVILCDFTWLLTSRSHLTVIDMGEVLGFFSVILTAEILIYQMNSINQWIKFKLIIHDFCFTVNLIKLHSIQKVRFMLFSYVMLDNWLLIKDSCSHTLIHHITSHQSHIESIITAVFKLALWLYAEKCRFTARSSWATEIRR